MSDIDAIIQDHLIRLALQPSLLSVPSDLLAGWSFVLSPNLISELYLCTHDHESAQLLLTTSIDIPPHSEMDTFAATTTHFTTPLSLLNTEDQLALRLIIVASKKTLPDLISEGIILTRHTAGAVFTTALSLCHNKSTLTESIQTTIDLLKRKLY